MKDDRIGAYTILASGGWWNQRLLKDCGIVPYLLHKNYGFHSVLVGYNANNPTLPYLETYLKGVEINFLSDDTLQTRIQYIDDHSKDMDLLILYGAYEKYVPIVDCYLKKRPDGKIYLVTDANTNWMDSIEHDNPHYKRLLDQCDVVGASCRKTQRYLNMKWSTVVDLIRNGWYNFSNVDFNNLFDHKENIILTVGRLGTKQKCTELLLEAFADCSDKIPDWRLRLVGKVEPKFNEYLDKFFAKYPNLKDRIEFAGLIEDKLKLAEEYKKAKIFILTSIIEGGTPNVIAEALYAGCYIITSDIDGASDATDEGRCGAVFSLDNKLELVDVLKRVCNNSNLITEGGTWAFNYAREYFDSEKIVAHLHYLLYDS